MTTLQPRDHKQVTDAVAWALDSGAPLEIVGGGSKNRLLCQATANAAKIPVVSFNLEGTAVGNIASQLIALRAVKDLKTFRVLLAKQIQQTVYQPRAQS